MNHIFKTIILLLCFSCVRKHDPNSEDNALAKEFEKIKEKIIFDVRNDLPLRAGMTVDQLQSFITNNEKLVSKKSNLENNPAPPIYADPEQHLYVFSGIINPKISDKSLEKIYLKYFVNGRHQFWLDITIQNNEIKNIFITPGNLNYIYPSFLFDGTGDCASCFKLN